MNEINVGPYTITQDPETGSFLIAHEDGESMRTTEAKLEVLFEHFWEAEF